MILDNVPHIFNRALSHTFVKGKLLLVFIILALCGILVVFSRGLAVDAGYWITMSLTFLPIFLCTGVLLALGIVLVRVYHDEVKGRAVSYRGVLKSSWELIMGAIYTSIPLILSYLLLWMLLGFFVLLSRLPHVGEFFAVTLSFAPFLLNLGALMLCAFALTLLFVVAPVVGLRGLGRGRVLAVIGKRLRIDVFANLLLGFIATVPLLVVIGVQTLAAVLSDTVCTDCTDPMYTVLQWFFVMIPFTALLSPAVIFFFNFAAEAHVLLQKAVRAPALDSHRFH